MPAARTRSTRTDELEQPERQREPAGLVREHAVVERDVERDADHDHQRGELERPPAVRQGSGDPGADEHGEQCREPRLDPAPQRVRHACTLPRKRRAAYFAPASVSAPGKAHWPGAPATASVLVASVSAGTVESGAEHEPAGRRFRDRGRRRAARAAGRSRKPRRKPVAQMTCADPFSVGSTRKRPSAAARAQRLVEPGSGRIGRGQQRRQASAARSSAGSCWNAARPRREKYGRGTFSGLRAGSRRRTETTSAPASSAFSHSVAAARPAPTTVTVAA